MSLDFATYSKIYDAVMIKNKSFDRVEVARALIEFMRDTYHISDDRIRNPCFVLPGPYFRKCIDDRREALSIVEKFANELYEQIDKLVITCQACVNEELRVKEEEIKKKIEKKERKLWNTQKSIASGKDKDGTSKGRGGARANKSKQDKASSLETTPDQSLETSDAGT